MVKIENSNWNMRQTPWQMHMPPHHPRIANFLKYHGSDRVKTDTWNTLILLSHKPEYIFNIFISYIIKVQHFLHTTIHTIQRKRKGCEKQTSIKNRKK